MNSKALTSEIVLGDRRYTVDKKLGADNSATYIFQSENGDAGMTVYTISPGIKVVHHSVRTDRSYLGTVKKAM